MNWGHGYYTVGRIKGSMVLKFETERKVNHPHKYLLSIIQQTIPMSLSLSLSVAHTARVSRKWPFTETSNFESAERDVLKNFRFYLVYLFNSVAVFLYEGKSQRLIQRAAEDQPQIFAKNSCITYFISTTCFKANDSSLCHVFLLTLIVAFYFIMSSCFYPILGLGLI